MMKLGGRVTRLLGPSEETWGRRISPRSRQFCQSRAFAPALFSGGEGVTARRHDNGKTKAGRCPPVLKSYLYCRIRPSSGTGCERRWL